MTSISADSREFEGNVVLDDDTGAFSTVEQEFTVVKSEPVFTLSRLCNAVVWIGVVIGTLIFGIYHAWLMHNVHEVQTHFSHITNIEREISFRTECGFYYSFYKKLVQAPSLWQGIVSLTQDQVSEFPSTVNALARFNIHPEVVLAFMYRNFGAPEEEPMIYYSRWVWYLQGVQGAALFLFAAIFCRSIIGGFLSTLVFCHIRPFATRAFFTVSLRENFSMPFFWLRLLILTILFRSHVRSRERKWCYVALFFSTFCFASFWQLSPFVLFAQGLPLYGGAMLNALDIGKVENVMLSDALVVFVVGILHFAYPLFLSSPAVTCAVLVYLTERCCPPPLPHLRKFWSVFLRCVALLLASVFTSGVLKRMLGVTDDNHVFKLFLAKLNIAYHHDFDVNMYLSSSVFRALQPSFFLDMTFGAFLLYPLYLGCHVIFLLGVLNVFDETTRFKPLTEYEAKKKDLDDKQVEEMKKKHEPSLLAYLILRRPELAMNALICVPMAALGCFIQRLQLLWTPHMCIFYAWVLATPGIYALIPLPGVLRKWFPRIMRYVIPIAVILFICSGYIPAIKHELSPQRRQTFSDPDTVDMMEWIRDRSRKNGVFSGSMQLMSAVHLSTGRPITNHPHYENGDLREKTRNLYRAIYGRSTIKNSFEILRNYSIDYIVIEPSICFAPSEGHPFAAFRMVDLLDQADGLQPEMGPFSGDPRLKPPTNPENPVRQRVFCEQLQPDPKDEFTYVTESGLTKPGAPNAKFRRVFKNYTFWIYEVIH